MFRPKKRHIELGTVFAALVALATIALVASSSTGRPGSTSTSPASATAPRSPPSTPPPSRCHFEFASDDEASEATLTVDGEPWSRSPPSWAPVMVWRPPAPLAEGDHTHRGGGAPGRVRRLGAHVALHRRRHRPGARRARPRSTPWPSATAPAVTGTVEEGAELTADGEAVDVDDDGGFTLRFDRPPAGPVTLEAADRAGNRTTASVVVPITYPGLRGVHVTAAAWSDPLPARRRARPHRRGPHRHGRSSTSRTTPASSATTPTVARALEIGAVAPHLRPRGGGGRASRAAAAASSGASSRSSDPVLAQAAWAAGPGRPGDPGRRTAGRTTASASSPTRPTPRCGATTSTSPSRR